jgi:Tol biopolymer transport system component
MFLSACVLAMLPGAGFGHSITSVAPTPDGKLLLVVSRTNTESWLGVWDVTKPELSAVVTALPADTHTVRPTADGKRFALVAGDPWHVRHLEVWDTAAKKRLRAFDVSARDTGTATVSPDGAWVAYRQNCDRPPPQIWNTDTGKRAEALEKAIGKAEGTIAFTADSKRFIVLTDANYTEYDLTTGDVAKTWKRSEPARVYRAGLYGDWVAVLPDGKGLASVTGTGKRRQSYVIHLLTEKKEWFLGEFWDHATAPVVSPDGRLLVVTGGRSPEGPSSYALKLDADGAPEMEDKPEKWREPFGGINDKKVPAWREWSLLAPAGGRADRALPERESVSASAFANDGKRLFVAGPHGRVYVHDTERRVLKATLFAAAPEKTGARPEWHVVTAAGEFVASPGEAKTLAETGKVKDVAKVKEALGVK